MVMIAGGGGGSPPSTSKLGIGIGAGYSAPVNLWEEEEERRRKELAKAQAQKRLTQKEKQLNPTWSAPTGEMKKRAEVARTKLTSMTDPLTDYWKMSRTLGGQDKLGERMRQVKALWDMYLKPTDGSKAIIDLVRSDFTIPEIEAMCQAGHMALYTTQYDGQFKVPAKLASMLELDPDDPTTKKRLELLAATRGYLSSVPSVAKSLPLLKTGWAVGYKDDPETVDWFLERGRWDNESLDPSEDLRAIEKLTQVRLESSKSFQSFSPEVQKRLAWLWYEATGAPDQESPWGQIEMTPSGMKRPEDSFREKYSTGWVSKDMTKEEEKAIQAGLSLWKARMRVSQPEQWEDIVGDYERGQDIIESVLMLGVGGGVFKGARLASQAIKEASAARRAYQGVKAGKQGLEMVGTPGILSRVAAGATSAVGAGGILYAGGKAVEAVDQTVGPDVFARKTARELTREAMEAPETLPGFVQELTTMTNNAHGLPQTDAVAMQQQIQEGISEIDPDTGKRVTIIGGYGKELEANGLWTWEWDQALADAWADNRRYNVEIQRRLLEAGYANPNEGLPVDGLIEGPQADPRWVEARERAERDLQAQIDYAREHPVLSKFLGMTGIPLTREGADAWWNRVFSNGPLTGVISLLTLEPVKRFGGAYNALLSTLTYSVVEDADQEYQDLKEQWALAVANGDEKAEEIKKRLLERQSQLLQSAFVPDPIMAASVGMGKDVEEAIAWSQDHPNWVLAASLARDVAVMKASPYPIRAAKGKLTSIKRTPEAFMRAIRPNSRLSAMLDYIAQKKEGLAEDVVKGTQASELVNRVSSVYNGRNRGKNAVAYYNQLASRLIQAADAHNLRGIEKATILRGTAAERLAGRIRNTQADPGLIGQAAIDSRLTNVSRLLGREQRSSHALLDMDAAAKEIAADMWGKGAAIFPYFQDVRLSKGSVLNRKLISAIADVENPALKRFLSVGLKQWQLKPMRHVDVDGVYGASRVFSNALAAFDDVGKALDIRSRWVRNPSPTARIKLAEEVKTQLAKRFKNLETGEPPTPALGVDPATGAVISEGAVGLPVYLRYAADFGPVEAAARAPFELVYQMPRFERALKKYIMNPERALERGLTKISNPLRQWTVATGPMLFVKHGFTDTSRTIADVGLDAVIRAPKQASKFESNMLEMTPLNASRVRYIKQKSRTSEEHFNIGGVDVKVDWSGAQIYVKNRRGVYEPTNMGRGVEALRRIATDPVFGEWARGGEVAVRSWLHTADGHKFMERGRHVQDFLDDGGELMISMGGNPVTRHTIFEGAVEYYIDRYVRGMLEGLNSQAHRITAGLADMALGRTALSEKAIKNLVKEVNANGIAENPYVSVPEMQSTNNFAPATWTARWMTPNKLNRVATFNHVFNKVYADMKKAGANADNAGLVAADLAELNVARIHFDLANALHIEAAHRWFAWFATKHRLYNTYVLKLAAERPSIAGAAQTLWNWLEQRNENQGLPEWDKHTIVLPVDWLPDWLPGGIGKSGASMRLNLDTIFWFAEYYTESSVGQLAEMAGAKITSYIPGVDVPYEMSGYGISTGRWDRLATTLGAFVTTVEAWGKGEIDDEWVEEWFEGEHWSWMGAGAKKRIQKSMDIQMAAAMREGRELTPAQAFKSAMTGALFYEGIQMFKVWPGRIVTGDEDYYEDAMIEFNKLTPEERYEKLDEDPTLRFLFGIYSTNPVDQYNVVQGWAAVSKLFKQRAVALEDALDNGTIFDKNKVDSIYAYYDDEIDKIVNPEWRDPDTGETADNFNKTFAEMWTNSGMAQLTKEEVFKSMFPLCDPRAVTKDGYIPTRYQRDKEQDRLQQEYEEVAKSLGLNPADTSDPRIQWLKEDLVAEPLRDYMKRQDGEGWTTNFANTVARDLARGEVGPAASAKFLTQIQNQEKLKIYAKGTAGDAKAGVSGLPMFTTMTTLEKEAIGWKSNEQTELIWRLYAQKKAALDDYMAESGISTSSALADDLRAELKRWGDAQAEHNPGFRLEWHFAQMPLWTRLETLGVGAGDSKVDQGWSAFLDVVHAYQGELANTFNKYTRSYGVGSTSQTAYPIYLQYAPRLVELKNAYPEWWKNLLQTFGGLSKFGFTRWRAEGPWDDELWYGQSTTIYEPPMIGGEG